MISGCARADGPRDGPVQEEPGGRSGFEEEGQRLFRGWRLCRGFESLLAGPACPPTLQFSEFLITVGLFFWVREELTKSQSLNPPLSLWMWTAEISLFTSSQSPCHQNIF